MSRVLLVGESWFIHSIHQKGFDAFNTSEYIEGAGDFLDTLRTAGHDVRYLPSHQIATGFPRSTAELSDLADVVIVSDVGANTFQLAPETFGRSEPTVDKTEVLRQFVSDGGGLLMVGGYLSFTGIDAKARWGTVPLAAALPVTLLERDDRVELPAGAAPRVTSIEHPISAGLDRLWPALLGLNQVVAKDGAQVLVECARHPLLVTGTYENGRAVAFMSDIAPHWAPDEFVRWTGYQTVFDRTVRWLNQENL